MPTHIKYKNGIAQLSQDVLYLADTPGFFALYEKTLQKNGGKSKAKVYESIEQMRLEAFGKRKFSSYDSFRICRAKSIKTKTNLQGVAPSSSVTRGIGSKCTAVIPLKKTLS